MHEAEGPPPEVAQVRLISPWAAPQETTALERAFPAAIGHLIPAMTEMPFEFRGHPSFLPSTWTRLADHWFMRGWTKSAMFIAVLGIDPEAAFWHVNTIASTYDIKHQHKLAAVAWLSSMWFVQVADGDSSFGIYTGLEGPS